MDYKILNNGIQMPVLGFGVCQIENLRECEEVVLKAIENGYRLIDTASIYHNEEAVGKAIKRSEVPREELFITTKLWAHFNSYEQAKEEFNSSLQKLGLEYIDLYLIHRPVGDYYGAWRALTELYKEGKIRAIGVSNFYNDRLVDLLMHQEIKPVVNQIQCHPFMQRKSEYQILKEYDIQMQCWSPFAVGKNNIFRNELLTKLAKKHNKTTAQIILRWHIQRGCVVIPKSVHERRMKENMEIFDFSLSQEEMNQIETLDTTEVGNITKESDYRLESLYRVFGTK
ncbi:MAG: aldo/keto reductase [Coprobacillaceae bacterium]